ncbi:hypothetical protein [Streptomyces sp. NRRL F-5630]|uniref:hypothetical protein n=1 Tax=Streptomyces sp. NRRL F-5630 TaxID=1463864 RepID=UPI003EB9B6AF
MTAFFPLGQLKAGPPPEAEPEPVGMDPVAEGEDDFDPDEVAALLVSTRAQRGRPGGGSCAV